MSKFSSSGAMSCVGERGDVLAGRRAIARRLISEPGSAVSIEGARSVVVEDISRKGARVCGHHLPTMGRQVLILADGLEVLGSVVWARFRERGIAFEEAPSGVAG